MAYLAHIVDSVDLCCRVVVRGEVEGSWVNVGVELGRVMVGL